MCLVASLQVLRATGSILNEDNEILTIDCPDSTIFFYNLQIILVFRSLVGTWFFNNLGIHLILMFL